MNKKMKSAHEKLAGTITARSEDEQMACMVAALNDISASISCAIFPINDVLLPFVGAVVSQYNDLLIECMNTEQKLICESAKEIIKRLGRKAEIKFPRKDN